MKIPYVRHAGEGKRLRKNAPVLLGLLRSSKVYQGWIFVFVAQVYDREYRKSGWVHNIVYGDVWEWVGQLVG